MLLPKNTAAQRRGYNNPPIGIDASLRESISRSGSRVGCD